MALAKKVCRVCGKPYDACRSVKKDIGVFYYQEVACSPECGAEYLRRVMESRNPKIGSKRSARTTMTIADKRSENPGYETEGGRDSK